MSNTYMDIGVKATLFCGSIVVFGVVDFIHEFDRLKKLKKEQDDQ